MPDVTTSRLELKSMMAQMSIRDLVRFFLPMVRPFWKELSLAFVARALGAGISVFRPWPLKVVIDLVISHKHCRVPLIGPWLDHAPLTKMQVLYGACAATILISLLSGALTYSVTRSLGAAAQRFVFTLRRDLFAHMQGLAQEEQLEERFEARSEGYLQAYLETLRYQARVGPLADLISAIGLTIVIWYGATRVLSGQLTTGDVVIFFAYATSFYRPMR